MFSLYAITNNVDGSVYIGKAKDPKRRWIGHRWHSTNIHLRRALIKHGVTNFSFDVFAVFDSEKECLLAEQEWIVRLRESGTRLYNQSDGGEGPGLGRIVPPEQRAKHSASRKGKCTGEQHPMFHGHPRQKLTEADVIAIKSADVSVTHEELAKLFGVSAQSIYAVRLGITWKHVRPDLTHEPFVFYHWHNCHTVKNKS